MKKMTNMTIYHVKNKTPSIWIKIRYKEITNQLENIITSLPSKLKFWSKKGKTTEEIKEIETKKESLKWKISHKIWVGIKLLLAFIFIIPLGILKIIKWFIKLFITTEDDVRKKFQSEVAHSALVSMYSELYEKLALGSYITSAF